MGFLEFAQLDALQDAGVAALGTEEFGDMEAVAAGFQDEDIGGHGVFPGPGRELGDGDLVEDPLDDGREGSGPLDDGRGETVRVDVETDDTLDRQWILVHGYAC